MASSSVAARLPVRRTGVLRHSSKDAALVALSVAHAIVLAARPAGLVIAALFWWNANTIAHNFIHLPFFRSRRQNRAFSIWMSLLLGVPQSLWRARHVRHHAGSRHRVRWTAVMTAEAAAVAGLWLAFAWLDPRWLLTAYVPGLGGGLLLSYLQGHYEHAGGTTSHYGRLYNACFFNDGYHAEHHAQPSVHWSALPALRRGDETTSPWPPVLRWIETGALARLERVVLRSTTLRRFVVSAHERAFRRLLVRVSGIRRATIVGGGLFPRTAIVLSRVLPDARLTIVERDPTSVLLARPYLGAEVALSCGTYNAGVKLDADLVVIPLAFVGDRSAVYRCPPAPVVLVHDWIWRRRIDSVVVSWLLLKRLALVRQ